MDAIATMGTSVVRSERRRGAAVVVIRGSGLWKGVLSIGHESALVLERNRPLHSTGRPGDAAKCGDLEFRLCETQINRHNPQGH